jgi:hypothetical protein
VIPLELRHNRFGDIDTSNPRELDSIEDDVGDLISHELHIRALSPLETLKQFPRFDHE